MSWAEYPPTEDERKLAKQLVQLAQSKTFGRNLAVEAVVKALCQARRQATENIEAEIEHLTPLEFHGTFLDKRSIDEAIDRGSGRYWT